MTITADSLRKIVENMPQQYRDMQKKMILDAAQYEASNGRYSCPLHYDEYLDEALKAELELLGFKVVLPTRKLWRSTDGTQETFIYEPGRISWEKV